MAGRAYWTGYLKLSLVSCQVKLYSATSSSAGKISFNLLHKKTMNRVNQKYHDPELGEIAREDLVKGYQFEKDRYVVVTPEELDAIEIESSKTIDIEGFVDAGEIDRLYFDSPYYLAPEGPIAQETYKVILEAMRAAKKVALARIVLSGRERLVAIEPQDNGFLVSTVRSAKEVRKASEYLEPIKAKVAPDMLAMAKQIIESKGYKMGSDGFYQKDGQPLSVSILVKAEDTIATPIIISSLQDVGINATPRALTGGSYGLAHDKGDFEIETTHVNCGSVTEPFTELNTLHSKWIKPAGQIQTPNIWGYKNAEYDKIVDQIAALPPNDAKEHALFRQALEIRLKDLPIIALSQQLRIVPYTSKYWTNWPTADNGYVHPPNWWQTFIIPLVNIKSASGS